MHMLQKKKAEKENGKKMESLREDDDTMSVMSDQSMLTGESTTTANLVLLCLCVCVCVCMYEDLF